jgi:hypothetical protein
MDLAILYLRGHNNAERLRLSIVVVILGGRGLFNLWKEWLIRAAKTTEWTR